MPPTDKKGEVQTGYFVEFIPGWWSRKGDGPATRNSLSGQVYHGSVTKEQVEQLTQIVRDFLNGKSAPSAERATVTDEMVDRFLAWRLPEDFHPDAGISFSPCFNVEYNAKHGKPPQRHQPIGTNLFTATQARQMLEHVLAPRSLKTASLEELERANAPTSSALAPNVEAMRVALEKIARWFGEFPPSGCFFPITDNGKKTEMSYGAAFGSNGERDYMREVARQALVDAPSASGSPVEHDTWNSAVDAAARTAMDMPLTSGEERHDYRWSDTYKAAALEISNAIRGLKRAT